MIKRDPLVDLHPADLRPDLDRLGAARRRGAGGDTGTAVDLDAGGRRPHSRCAHRRTRSGARSAEAAGAMARRLLVLDICVKSILFTWVSYEPGRAC
jgi:hypothetical protein